jgi:hypothetical protein
MGVDERAVLVEAIVARTAVYCGQGGLHVSLAAAEAASSSRFDFGCSDGQVSGSGLHDLERGAVSGMLYVVLNLAAGFSGHRGWLVVTCFSIPYRVESLHRDPGRDLPWNGTVPVLVRFNVAVQTLA